MARVTIEDCLKNASNRFELVFTASQRARQLSRDGATPLVPWDNDKPTVVALREIAEVRTAVVQTAEASQLNPSKESIDLDAITTITTVGDEDAAQSKNSERS